ncbi:hypothetical protein Ciccas_002922 [Cichlidogyrus casuarinus]|uniref:Ribosome biogenesis protein NOP53 n=1 Tax=Cichlidogyrus casuarinus TaxID=1844966 RepID=A0ABD2QFV2_9PLAT
MGKKNSHKIKMTRLNIARTKAIKQSKPVVYIRKVKTRKHKKSKNISDFDEDVDVVKSGYDIAPNEQSDCKIPRKLKEIMFFKSNPQKYTEQFNKSLKNAAISNEAMPPIQGKRESDKKFVARIQSQALTEMEKVKGKIITEKEMDRLIKTGEQPKNNKKQKMLKRLKERQRAKIELKNSEFDVKDFAKDTVKFGEVVLEPPKFKVMPKRTLSKQEKSQIS